MPSSQGQVSSYVANAAAISTTEPTEHKQDPLKLLPPFPHFCYCDSPSLEFKLGSTVAKLEGKSSDDP